MKTHVIVKTHEVALKGKNRPRFMSRLAGNLRKATQGTGVQSVWQGHLLVGLTLQEESQWDCVASRVKDCFGVAKFFKAYEVPASIDEVKDGLRVLLEGREFSSFRITSNRADKGFPIRSSEINRDLGTYVQGLTGARVDLTHPDLEIFVDVLPTGILLYFGKLSGYGGLPVGVSGEVMAMLSGGIDSPVAAWHMMKRGCRVSFAHFHSYPMVDRSSIEKAEELARRLTRHQYESKLFLVPFGDIQKRIIVSTDPAYRVILYRRLMVRITERLAQTHGGKVMVTGESCGQVSSQTLDNMAVIDQASSMLILRPLVGFNKEEIVTIARDIGTFPISILPDQDCCSLFVPRHPETHAELEKVCRLESVLPVDDLVKEAVAKTERKEFQFTGSVSD